MSLSLVPRPRVRSFAIYFDHSLHRQTLGQPSRTSIHISADHFMQEFDYNSDIRNVSSLIQLVYAPMMNKLSMMIGQGLMTFVFSGMMIHLCHMVIILGHVMRSSLVVTTISLSAYDPSPYYLDKLRCCCIGMIAMRLCMTQVSFCLS